MRQEKCLISWDTGALQKGYEHIWVSVVRASSKFYIDVGCKFDAVFMGLIKLMFQPLQ